MNQKNEENCYHENLLQYAIDINWLINRLSKTKRHEAIAYELAVFSIDIYKYQIKSLSQDERSSLFEKVSGINNCLLVLQKNNKSELNVEINRLIAKANLILNKENY